MLGPVHRQFTRSVAPKVAKRFLSLHEFRSAHLLETYGVGVPPGKPAFSAKEAEQIAKDLGGKDLVVKTQALTGGRGKGHLSSGLQGGVQMANSPEEAAKFASEMIGSTIYTKQTGPAGKPVSAAYIVRRETAIHESYVSILYDRSLQQPIVVASAQGGMDIEGVAKKDPSAIKTYPIDLAKGVTDAQGAEIAAFLGFTEKAQPEAARAVQGLYKLFDERDCTLVEINPLSETDANRVVAMDTKLSFDDNAEFRQKEVFSWRDLSQEDPEEVKAHEFDLNFVKLDGNVGCLVNGAGLAMATMDIVKLSGGEPANFLDCGGGATPNTIKEAFKLILTEKKIKSIFVNIFGGIVRCDDIAQGLIDTAATMDLKVPIVARLQGTNFEKADELIAKSGLKIYSFTDLTQAAEKAVALSK